MCIAGSRRGSGESCYQELATEAHGPRQSQLVTVETATQPVTLVFSSPTPSPPPTAAAAATTAPTAAAAAAADNDLREQEKQTAEITVDSAEQNAVFVRISEDGGGAVRKNSAASSEAKSSPRTAGEDVRGGVTQRRRLSDAERILLESLDVGRCRPRHTGRFLTMHKRRRKRLTTRSLNQEPAILDDIFHGMVQCVLQKAGNWRFNAFTLETVTGGRSLPVLCVHLFHWYGLFRTFDLDVVTVWKLFAFIEEGYHSTNPYHNSIHATDVTQAMHCFLQEEKIRRHLTDLEIMASLIAAVTHDLDHPGVNQPFLVATSNHLAALYQNTSVLENHHWRSAIGCLIESGVSDQLPAEVRPELQRHISSLILATDITRQQEFLTRFKHYLDEKLLDMQRPEDRHFILQIALKCADISNPCRPWDISRKWSYKVCEEFFRQGDYERQLNLPVTPLCDRHTTSIPKIQVGFFKFVVTPLYEEWHRFLGDEFSASLMDYLHANQKKWEALILQETAEETKTEISELEELDNIVSSGDEEAAEEDSGSIDLLMAAEYIQSCRRPSLPGKLISARVGRRHSVPLSLSKPLTLFPNAGERRESLPTEQSKIRNPLLKLEDQSLLDPSTLSLLSSRSSVLESSTNASTTERPVSAENLLPETSIASITNSTEASRLSSVLQGDNLKPAGQGKQLTRQQTFPPLQPCVRRRYMSTTAEMAHCYTHVLVEADGSSSPSLSPTRDEPCSGGRCGTPPVIDVGSSRLKLNVLKSSRELYVAADAAGKRRVSAFSEVTRLKKESAAESEQPRRHSMQTLRASSPLGAKQRSKRPSSAQETTDSTRIFYESLTSSYGERDAPERRGTPDSSSERKLCADSRTSPSSSGAASNRCVVLPCARPDVRCVVIDTDSRRYSTPETRTKPCEPTSGRRFTTIPVSSELSTHKVFFIGSPPDSPPRVHSVSSSSDSGSEHRRNVAEPPSDGVSLSGKRDSDSFREKSPKIAKLSLDGQMKENVDPKTLSAEDPDKCNALPKRGTQQGWARRRGSAPVGLLSRLDDITVTPVTRIDYSSKRRGSVPTDIIRHQGGGFSRLTLGPRGENLPETRRASLPQETAFGSFLGNFLLPANERENCPINNYNNNNNNNGASNNNGFPKCSDMNPPVAGMPSPRRGSVPADISELRRDLLGRSSVNGKSRNRKKVLRRRSSGGPEMFAGGGGSGGGGGGGGSVETNENGTWLKWKREAAKRDSIPEPVVKRRGSLPIEMVAVSHAGTAAGPRRSSLWRF